MSRLIAALIRHGDYQQLPNTPSALQPFPLTTEGQQQAQAAASAIRSMANKWQCTLVPEIHSSNLLRAWETAAIIKQELHDVFPDEPELTGFDALAERSLGSAANLSVDRIEEIIRLDPRFTELPAHWKSDSHFRLPLQGAESLLEAGARVAEHLQQSMQTLAQTAGQNRLQLFVGHGAAFRHAAYHLGILQLDQVAGLSMYHARPVLIEYHPDDGWQHIDGEWKHRSPASSFDD